MEYLLSNLGINQDNNQLPRIREGEANRLLQQFPDRIPVLISHTGKGVTIDKRKYLVPKDLELGQFLHVLRRRTTLRPTDAIFLFISSRNLIVPMNKKMGVLYEELAEEGFLETDVEKLLNILKNSIL